MPVLPGWQTKPESVFNPYRKWDHSNVCPPIHNLLFGNHGQKRYKTKQTDFELSEISKISRLTAAPTNRRNDEAIIDDLVVKVLLLTEQKSLTANNNKMDNNFLHQPHERKTR